MVYCHQALKEETQKTQRLSGGLKQTDLPFGFFLNCELLACNCYCCTAFC